MNEDTLMEFVHKGVDDVGTLVNSALVTIGDQLGLYFGHGRGGRADRGGAGLAY